MTITRRTTFIAFAGAAAVAACSPPTIAGTGLTVEAFAAWLDRYGAAWETRDASAAGALFSEEATYHEMPFDAPMEGRAAIEAYWTRVTEGQSDIHFSSNVIATQGDQGVAHWHAAFNAGGAAVELDGVFVIAFADDGASVRSLREWWHVQSTPPA